MNSNLLSDFPLSITLNPDTVLPMDAPSDIPSSNLSGQMQPRFNGERARGLQTRPTAPKAKVVPPQDPRLAVSEEMMGSGMGATGAKYPSEDTGWVTMGGTRIPSPWNSKKKGKTVTKESIDESAIPKNTRRKAAKDCGFYIKHMEHHSGTPKGEMYSKKAMRAALKAGLSVTNPGQHANPHLTAAYKAGYDKADLKLTGKSANERGPLDAREHIFGFIKESTESTNKTQEPTMNITEILSDITSGKTTAQEAAAAMANALVERGLKPRALQRFVAWGKEGNERRTRRDLPGGQNAEYQKQNGPHLGESEEQVGESDISEGWFRVAKSHPGFAGVYHNAHGVAVKNEHVKSFQDHLKKHGYSAKVSMKDGPDHMTLNVHPIKESEEQVGIPEELIEMFEEPEADELGEGVVISAKGLDLSKHSKLKKVGAWTMHVGKNSHVEHKEGYRIEVLKNDKGLTGAKDGVTHIVRTDNPEHAKAVHDFKRLHTTSVLTPIQKHGEHYVFGYGHRHRDADKHAQDVANVAKFHEKRRATLEAHVKKLQAKKAVAAEKAK